MKQQGFTLIEVMIVVAIIGLLAAIALPSYNKQVRDSRRADAMAVLVEAGGAMERYFTENNTYTGASFGSNAGDIFPGQSPIDGGTAYYNLNIQANSGSTYTLRATPTGSQAGNNEGILELSSTGAKAWDENGDGDTTDAGENNWRRN